MRSLDAVPVVRLWRQLPVVVRAVLTGVVVGLAGSLPWALLVSANTKHWSVVPWAVPITLVYLWFYWRFVRGEGWPQSTAALRAFRCRARTISEDAWGSAIMAGVLGLATVLLFQRVLNRLVTLPQEQRPDISQYPVATVFLWLLTSALVAGLVEETAFRGYMQQPIEERHGPLIAILVTGIAFGFSHFGHPEVTVVLLSYYIAVAAVYGALAYFTNSIYPSMLLHAVGNVLGSLDLFTRGHAEWQASPAGGSLVWETGVDVSFMLSVGVFLIVGALTLFAYLRLRNVTRGATPTGGSA